MSANTTILPGLVTPVANNRRWIPDAIIRFRDDTLPWSPLWEFRLSDLVDSPRRQLSHLDGVDFEWTWFDESAITFARFVEALARRFNVAPDTMHQIHVWMHVEVPFSGTKYVRVAQVADDQGELEDAFNDIFDKAKEFAWPTNAPLLSDEEAEEALHQLEASGASFP